ncbi:MAG: D-cysteine desulfhydrase family protein [Rhodospirillales bacterium]|nr:D-cysteine desulfhydrase family protein [Rhodospirillales bacterium]
MAVSLTAKFPRVTLAHAPTPLEPMPHLSRLLGGPKLYVKRDDCTGLFLGGNKARQLEYYFGAALAEGADTVLTTGAVQSNHARQTAAAARKLGLGCEIQLENRVSGMAPEYYNLSGNVLLYRLLGVPIHTYPVGEDEEGADAQLEGIAAGIRDRGGKPYIIPLAARHPPLGALGYVDAMAETLEQARAQKIEIDAIVLPTGSAATHAGTLAGLRALGSRTKVFGICIRRNAALQSERVLARTRAAAKLLGTEHTIGNADVWVTDDYLGPGYGLPTPGMMEATELAAQTEALLVDPVYTGKAMAGLIGLVRKGHFKPSDTVVFLHTGGIPSLFGYQAVFGHEPVRP